MRPPSPDARGDDVDDNADALVEGADADVQDVDDDAATAPATDDDGVAAARQSAGEAAEFEYDDTAVNWEYGQWALPPWMQPRPVLAVQGDWESVLDRASGYVFYYNRRTGGSQWEAPATWDAADGQASR